MGFYDNGAYGGYNSLDERESARDRYLDLLAKQRTSNQAMADKMRREEDEANRNYSADNVAESGVSGAQKGMAVGGPWGALIGGVLGKAAGAVQHGQKYGVGAGLKSFFNPINTIKAIVSNPSGQQLANDVGRRQEQYQNERRIEDLLAAQNRKPAGQSYSAYEGASDMGDGQKFGDFKFKDEEDEYAFG